MDDSPSTVHINDDWVIGYLCRYVRCHATYYLPFTSVDFVIYIHKSSSQLLYSSPTLKSAPLLPVVACLQLPKLLGFYQGELVFCNMHLPYLGSSKGLPTTSLR